MRISDWSSDVCSSDLCGRFHHWRGYADDIDAASPKLGPERFRQIEDETLDARINGDTGLTTQSCARPHQHDPATSALPHGTSEDMQSLSGCQQIAGDQLANGFDRGEIGRAPGRERVGQRVEKT